MNILLIKQTSLGDVLHATPHIRAIKARYPDAQLTVLTAQGSAEIVANNPNVDRLVLFDYVRFKRLGLKSPRALRNLFKQTIAEINDREYEFAFDLQGLARSVVFLYAAPAKRKFVKGNWPGLGGFRNKQMHAIDEMTQVLAQADIPVDSIQMAFYRDDKVRESLRSTLAKVALDELLDGGSEKSLVVISPFTRWASKNWPLDYFLETAAALAEESVVLITGTAQDRKLIEAGLNSHSVQRPERVNLAGELSLAELAELMSHAGLVISGDSFPMHLATAVGAPLLALFGPTDESKTGPRSDNSLVLRPDDCAMCDKRNCDRGCLEQIPVQRVVSQARRMLGKR